MMAASGDSRPATGTTVRWHDLQSDYKHDRPRLKGFVTRATWNMKARRARDSRREGRASRGADIRLDTGVATNQRARQRGDRTSLCSKNGDEFTSATVLYTRDPKPHASWSPRSCVADPEFMMREQHQARGSTAYVMYGVDTEVEPHGSPGRSPHHGCVSKKPLTRPSTGSVC